MALQWCLLHRDSLGSEQLIRAGELNLMRSGHGVAHSEENPGLTSGEMHGMQLWVALPSTSRGGVAAFEHLTGLPQPDLTNASATVLVGSFADSNPKLVTTLNIWVLNSTSTEASLHSLSSPLSNTRSSLLVAKYFSMVR